MALLLGAALVASVSADAQSSILHEFLPPDPTEDVSLAATTLDGDLPAAVQTPSGIVTAPDPQRAPDRDHVYGGATTETAYATAESLLATYADVDGIFCPNESTAFGMLLAIQAAGRAGKIHLVGFDASDKLIEGLRQGNIDGLVVQNPFRMGETGVNFLLQSLKGQTVPRRVDTGATMVTHENMDQPEIKALLQPDLATYLN